MTFAYNRRVALVLTLLVVLGAILIGGGTSLQRERNQTRALFQNGIQGDGLSIYNDLLARQDSAFNMLTLAKKYMDAGDSALTTLDEAAKAISSAQSVAEYFDANYALTLAADHLYTKLREKTLTDKDDRLLAGQFAELTSRNQIISHDGYNSAAGVFNEMMRIFPTSFIAAVNGVQPLELFR